MEKEITDAKIDTGKSYNGPKISISKEGIISAGNVPVRYLTTKELMALEELRPRTSLADAMVDKSCSTTKDSKDHLKEGELLLAEQPDGNWKGWYKKRGKVREERQFDPLIVLQLLLTKE